MKRLLSILLTVMLLAGLVSLPAQAVADTWYGTVEGGWLRLRSGASFSADTVNSYNVGTVVEILDTNGDWYKVKTPDGSVGYMYSKYLARGGSYSGSSSYTGVTNATVVSANGYGVRLRQGPSTSYRIIRKYPVGTRAEILEQGSYWSRIRIEGRTGYMMNRFLSRDGGITPPGPHYDGDATVWSSNGYGVRLRSGPGLSYRKIGVYSVGTQVTILSKGSVWDYVQIGSRIGYMMNKFLIYNNNYNVSGVTINNYNPVVCNILSVQTVTPSSATVTFQWYADKEKRGTDASYTITAADVGKQMRLVVSGIGYYSGYAVSDPTAAVLGSGTVTAVALNITQPYAGNILRAESITPTGATVSYQWKNAADNTILGTGESYTVTADDAAKGRQIYLTVTGTNTYNGTATSVTTSPVQQAAAPTITTTALANATRGASYKDTLKAIGGGSGFTWTIASGTLPAGLSLNAATGVISGTVAATATTQSVTFKVSNGYAPDAQTTLTIAVQDQVSAPVFSPDGGSFDKLQAVTLSCSTAGASIYYTTDGTEPTASSTQYHSPFFLANTTTVKAVAILGGLSNSAVVTKVFTLTKTVEPEFSPAGGAYTAAQNVAITCDTTGASIYYTTDGTTPTTASTKYTAPIPMAMDTTTTLKAIAVANGVAASGVVTETYIISGRNSYSIAYNLDGGTINYTYPTTYDVGVGATLPTTVTKANSSFAGWYTDNTYTTPVTAISATDTGDKTFYAKWSSATTHAITYDMNHGGQTGTIAGAPATYVQGQVTPLPTTGITPPIGYTFAGWFSDVARTAAITQITDAQTADVTVYAKWDSIPPKPITYVVNGVSNTTLTPTTYVEGVETPLPTSVNGITTFHGWYTTGDMTGAAVSKITTTDTGAKTFYGGGEYTVTLHVNNGDGIPADQTVIYGKTPADLAPTDIPTPPTGKTFGGYYDGTATNPGTQYYDKDGNAVRPWNKGADTNLYAYYTDTSTLTTFSLASAPTLTTAADPALTTASETTEGGTPVTGDGTPAAGDLTVTYKANYGEVADHVVTCAANATVTTPTADNLTRAGYALTGWNTAADGSGAGKGLGETLTVTESVTLYAQWTKEAYAIAYELNGGTETTANPTSYTVEANDFMLRNPTKTDANGNDVAFAGWTGTGVAEPTLTVTIVAGSTGNRTYTAHWAGETAASDPVDESFSVPSAGSEGQTGGQSDGGNEQQQNQGATYNIIYYDSAFPDVPAPDPAGPYASGTDVIIRTCPPKEGSTFEIWCTTPDGTGRFHAPGSQVTLEGNLSLYALWVQSEGGTENQNVENQGLDSQSLENQNLGDQNLGNQNLGNQNLENQNLGDQSLGNQNLENQNLGDQNLGNQNLDSQNLGDQNLGNQNLDSQNIDSQNQESGGATPQTPVTVQTVTENVPEPPATYALVYYTAAGQQISAYSCTLEQNVVVAAYPEKAKAVWNTQADGKGLTYKTGSELTITGDVALYYMGPVPTTQTTTDTDAPKTAPNTPADTTTDASNVDVANLW